MGYVSVYNAVDGVTLNTRKTDEGYDATKMKIAECTNNLKLHSGNGNYRIHNNFISNTWISA